MILWLCSGSRFGASSPASKSTMKTARRWSRSVAAWTVLESKPVPTGNIHAESQPTVRIYRVFDARITDPALMNAMPLNSQRNSNPHLEDLVRENVRKGSKRWANAFLALPLEALVTFYNMMPGEGRNSLATFEGCALEPNITTLLDDALAPKYQQV